MFTRIRHTLKYIFLTSILCICMTACGNADRYNGGYRELVFKGKFDSAPITFLWNEEEQRFILDESVADFLSGPRKKEISMRISRMRIT